MTSLSTLFSFCRWNVLDCLKSEPEQNILCKGKNNEGARNTRSTFEYSCHFSDVTLHYMAAFLTPVAEKHSRRPYLHACMQASEESNISYMAGYF